MKRDGPFSAVVVNNIDPLALGRVMVEIAAWDNSPALWARLLVPRAGNAQGIYFRPEIGDEVVVDFLNGDPDRPVVLGGLWNETNQPPTALQGQSVIRTQSGHTVVFDDAHNAACIEITTSGGHSVLLSDEAGSSRIEISNAGSESRIVIDDNGRITIAADRGDIAISAAGGDLILTGVNIQLNAAAQIDITGTAGVETATQGAARLQGSLVQLDGGAVLVNGAPLA